MFTTIGKKQMRAITISLGPIPKPNQITRIGAITTIGTAWEATTMGYRARRSIGERWSTTATSIPAATAIANPSSTSCAVTHASGSSTSRSSTMARATSLGAGRR